MVYGPGGTGNSNIFVAKFLPNGAPAWITGETQGSDPGNNTGLDIHADENGSIFMSGLFGGSKISLGSNTMSVFDFEEAVCARLDPATGQYIWSRAIRGYNPLSNTYDFATGIFTDHQNHVYVGGAYYGMRCDFDSIYMVTTPSNSQNPFGQKVFLFKLDDATGAPIWGKGYGDSPDSSVSVQGWAINDAADRIAFTGIHQGFCTIGSITFPNTVNQSFDAYLVEIDTAGNAQRGLSIFGTVWDVGYSVNYDDFGRLVTCGYFNSPLVSFDNQASLTHPDPQGYMYNIYLCRIAPQVITGIEDPEAPGSFSLFPNPAADALTLTRSKSGKCTVRIYDNCGKLIREAKYDSNQLTINMDVADLSSGHYIIECESDKDAFRSSFIKL
jgi:hypothetical protein